ncbi:putative periplasmic serine endoprotease DegP-like precursor [Posidoniimonas corsicana]|uniref:Putative periplasmic serine endoprotease DegP-like n=1 Tax=Posidoniimonas corsicana TaxID=1938618 RepID=A0A5C5VE40_9BACT|nr:trypsin-like peptidase domain-containing protein [Posidoniimonas corsicana]TWT36431.1 putative periplasmic serine endoprotease DegP-like precursor [Posidoniimonas corsicana]
MQSQPVFAARLASLVAVTLLAAPITARAAEPSDLRMTPVVRAVRDAAPSVVNIQGQKVIAATGAGAGHSASREVSGMGTGVVIDPRGYILTNHHVVAGVRQINVTLDDGRHYIAKVVAHDARTDLAVIKVNAGRPLPTITLGTSSDLMTGESVIAIGNAYGYEHTVTRGIISQLHRDVQVSDTQSYDDLIQTDASINPGNSGGPLLSIEGKMIGVNVAVRAGAQGIGFAIPVDAALGVTAELLSIERMENKWHGIETAGQTPDGSGLVVRRVASGGPAAACGLRPGDVIRRVNNSETQRPLDIELALLGTSLGKSVPVEVLRDDQQVEVSLSLAARGRRVQVASQPADRHDDLAWDLLGMDLAKVPDDEFEKFSTRYRGGMRVVDVRPGGPAAKQGIRDGDILVGMHEWETASEQDLRYITTRANLATRGPVKFYILRDGETLFGHIACKQSASRR